MAELSVGCYSFTVLFVSITSASTKLVWLESLTYGQSSAASCLLFMDEIKQFIVFLLGSTVIFVLEILILIHMQTGPR